MEEKKRERRVTSNFRLSRENEKHKSSWTGLVHILL